MTQQLIPIDMDQLYREYNLKIYSYAYRRTSDQTGSEDITQETFLKAMKSHEAGSGPFESVSGWLYRIAHNLVIDYYRARDKRRLSDLDSIAPGELRVHKMEAELEIKEEFQMLMKSVSILSEAQRQAFLLRFVDGYTFVEVARMMNKSEGAAKALIHRARATLYEAHGHRYTVADYLPDWKPVDA